MSKQRAKGTSFETSLIPLLRTFYPEAERRGAHGMNDKGDFHLPGEHRFILEAKNEVSYAGKLSTWLVEAYNEGDNALRACSDKCGWHLPVVVHKRKGNTDPEAQYVTMTLGHFLSLLHEYED